VRAIAGTRKIEFERRGDMLIAALGLQQMGSVRVIVGTRKIEFEPWGVATQRKQLAVLRAAT